MFCRFCGAQIAADSRFCSRCGKRLAGEPGSLPAWLKTPYPWAGLLFLLFLGWTLLPEAPGVDLSALKLELELETSAASPEDGVYRQYVSLVVENTGPVEVAGIPVDLRVRVQPDQRAGVIAEFRGGRFVVLQDGEPIPLTLFLSDTIAASAKRRFPIDSIVTVEPPADVTYSIYSEDGELLATLTARIDPEAAEAGAQARLGGG